LIEPRADGLITRAQAAELCGVTPEAVTNWTRVGYGPKGAKVKLPVARRESGHPLYRPADVLVAEYATRHRARRQYSAA
jgi:DNA-binding transcriptional MerR regulator